MSTEKTIVLKKRIAASSGRDKEGKVMQFFGSGYINRQKDGESCSCSPDAAIVSELLPDLAYDEGEIDVEATISLEDFSGARKMWCFGGSEDLALRCVTPHKPRVLRTDSKGVPIYGIKRSYFYLDHWCRNAYFEQIGPAAIFPVYVSVQRINNK